MSDIRAMIRELLAEEIAAIRAELSGAVRTEVVRVRDGDDLTRFAQDILRRAADPAFASALAEGRVRFAPDGAGPAMVTPAMPAPAPVRPVAQPMTLVTTVPAAVPELTQGLITERDIARIPEDQKRLRIGRKSRLTPLAGDEARRRGIRIERSAT